MKEEKLSIESTTNKCGARVHMQTSVYIECVSI